MEHPASALHLMAGKIPRYPEALQKEIRKLIKKRCCNYQDGKCIALDWDHYPVCPQSIALSLICKWFRDAVLPGDRKLEMEIFVPKGAEKACAICKRKYIPSGPRSWYCPSCSQYMKRKKTRERVARFRGNM